MVRLYGRNNMAIFTVVKKHLTLVLSIDLFFFYLIYFKNVSIIHDGYILYFNKDNDAWVNDGQIGQERERDKGSVKYLNRL